jgi:hypothetical protein
MWKEERRSCVGRMTGSRSRSVAVDAVVEYTALSARRSQIRLPQPNALRIRGWQAQEAEHRGDGSLTRRRPPWRRGGDGWSGGWKGRMGARLLEGFGEEEEGRGGGASGEGKPKAEGGVLFACVTSALYSTVRLLSCLWAGG